MREAEKHFGLARQPLFQRYVIVSNNDQYPEPAAPLTHLSREQRHFVFASQTTERSELDALYTTTPSGNLKKPFSSGERGWVEITADMGSRP